MIERFKNRKLDAQETTVLGHIESHGWSVTNIREEHGRPGWSFTIGLFENYGHPEVILFGLKAESRHRILNWIGENARDGKVFTAGNEHDWVLDGHNCFSREVHPNWYGDLIGWAMWFYGGGSDFPMVQCIWPSRDGLYPWQDANYSQQPLLDEADLVPARMTPYAGDETLLASDWPFFDDPHTGVYVSRCVMALRSTLSFMIQMATGSSSAQWRIRWRTA